MPGGGSGMSDSRGAVVIPEVGTVFFHTYRMTGPWGSLDADSGVLVSSDGEAEAEDTVGLATVMSSRVR
jgi:hypothetical protein